MFKVCITEEIIDFFRTGYDDASIAEILGLDVDYIKQARNVYKEVV